VPAGDEGRDNQAEHLHVESVKRPTTETGPEGPPFKESALVHPLKQGTSPATVGVPSSFTSEHSIRYWIQISLTNMSLNLQPEVKQKLTRFNGFDSAFTG